MPPYYCRLTIGLAVGVTLQATELWTEQNVPANFDLYGVAAARLLQADNLERSSFFVAGEGGIWRGDSPLAGEWELVLDEPGSRYRAVASRAIGLQSSVEAVGEGGMVTRSPDGENWTSATISGAGNFNGLAVDPIQGTVVAVDDLGQVFYGSSVAALTRRPGLHHRARAQSWRPFQHCQDRPGNPVPAATPRGDRHGPCRPANLLLSGPCFPTAGQRLASEQRRVRNHFSAAPRLGCHAHFAHTQLGPRR